MSAVSTKVEEGMRKLITELGPDGLRCGTCSYQGTVPGSAHSTCNHPVFVAEPSLKFQVLMLNMAGATERLGPKFDVHGRRMGWASWPVDFDPCWMEGSCGMHSVLKKRLAELEAEYGKPDASREVG